MKKISLFLIVTLLLQVALLSSCFTLPSINGSSESQSSSESTKGEGSSTESSTESSGEDSSESSSESDESSENQDPEAGEHTHVYDGIAYRALTATCSRNGRLAGNKCSICGEMNPDDILPMDPNNHSFDGEHYEATAPTCSATGCIEGYKCSGCGIVNPSDVLPIEPDNHVYDGTAYRALSATCSRNGRLAGNRCSGCNQINPDDILPKDPTKHSFDGEYYPAVEPTCETDGCQEGYKCSGCGIVNPADILPMDPDNHVYDGESYEAIAPTCSTPGRNAGKKCSTCGEIDPTNVLPAVPENHVYDGESYAAIPSTCSSYGRNAGKKCSGCGLIDPTNILPLDPTNHTYDGEDYAAIPSTCTTHGRDAGKTCSGCGVIDPTNVLPLDPDNHTSFNGESYGAIEPTCDEPGHKAGKRCTDCGAINPADILPAASNGHEMGAWRYENGGFVRVCLVCGGAEETVSDVYVYRTSVSDENYAPNDIVYQNPIISNNAFTMSVTAKVDGWYSLVPTVTAMPTAHVYLAAWSSALGSSTVSYNLIRTTAPGSDATTVYLTKGMNTVTVHVYNTAGSAPTSLPAISEFRFYLIYSGTTVSTVNLQPSNHTSGASSDTTAINSALSAGKDYLTTGVQGFQPNGTNMHQPLNTSQVYYYGQKLTVSTTGVYRVATLGTPFTNADIPSSTAVLVITDRNGNEVYRTTLSKEDKSVFENAGVYGTSGTIDTDFANVYMDGGIAQLEAGSYSVRIGATSGTWCAGSVMLISVPVEAHTCVYDGLSYDAIAPTCKDPGRVAGFACSGCGAINPEDVRPATGVHVYNGERYAAITPTCTTPGREAGVSCSGCGQVNPADILLPVADNHSYTGEYYAKEEPTCNSDGWKAGYACAYCGERNPADAIPSDGVHSYSSWVLNVDTKQFDRSCTGCGNVVESVSPAYSYRTTLGNNNYAQYDITGVTPTLNGSTYTANVNSQIDGFYMVVLTVSSIPSSNGYLSLWGSAQGEGYSSYNFIRSGASYVARNNVLSVYLQKGSNTVNFVVPSGMRVSSVDFRLASAGTAVSGVTLSSSDYKSAGEGYQSALAYRTDLPANAVVQLSNRLTVSKTGVYRLAVYGHAYHRVDSKALIRLTNNATNEVVSIPLTSDNEKEFSALYGGMDGYSSNMMDGGLISLDAGTYSVSVTSTGKNVWITGGIVLMDNVSRTHFYDDGEGAEGTATVHVDADAATNGNGTYSAPYNSVKAGYDAAVTLINSGSANDVTILLADGTYVLSETLHVSGADLSRRGKIAFKAENAGNVTFTSEISFSGSHFTNEGNGVYSYQLPEDRYGNYPAFRDASLNGTRLTLAKSTNDGFFAVDSAYNAGASGLNSGDQLLYVRPSLFSSLSKDAQGYFLDSKGNRTTQEIWFVVQWKVYVLRADYISSTASSYTDPVYGDTLVPLHIISEDWSHFLTSQYHSAGGLAGCQYWVANNKALLTENGTFYYDNAAGKVYVKTDANMSNATFGYATLEHLVTLSDAENITFDGITFTGTTLNEISENGYITGQAGRSMRMVDGGHEGYLEIAALYGKNVRNITVQNCIFDETAYDAIYFHGAVEDVTVSSSKFLSIGGTAVRIGESTDTYTSALYNKNITIDNNYIDGTGVLYYLCPGICVSAVDTLNITRNTIMNTTYSAIHVGYNWVSYKLSGFKYAEDSFVHVKNAKISGNFIQDYMTRLADGGAIYVVGGNAPGSNETLFNEISNNYIVVTSKTGSEYKSGPNGTVTKAVCMVLYHDGGSSNWKDKDNVIVRKDDAKTPFSYIYYQVSAGGPATNSCTERAYIVSADMSDISKVIDSSFSANRAKWLEKTQDASTGAWTLIDGAYAYPESHTGLIGTGVKIYTNIVRSGVHAYTSFTNVTAAASTVMQGVYAEAGSSLVAKPTAYGVK